VAPRPIKHRKNAHRPPAKVKSKLNTLEEKGENSKERG